MKLKRKYSNTKIIYILHKLKIIQVLTVRLFIIVQFSYGRAKTKGKVLNRLKNKFSLIEIDSL